MEFRLLGPVELWSGGREIPLGRPRQRCVLASLAMSAGEPVDLESLLTRVWGEDLPGDARNVLYTYVSRLRRALTELPATEARDVLRRVAGGYVLAIDPDSVDLYRARRLAGEGRLAARGDLPRAAELFHEAAALWRGIPLSGLTGAWVHRTRKAIGEERLAILIDWFTARLRLGEHRTVIGPISDLMADHPLAESLANLLMLALYRSGRTADALRLYVRLRDRLVEEIGDEPGPPLRRLYEAILRRDPGLELGQTGALRTETAVPDSRLSAAGRFAVVPAQLPAQVDGFAARTAELEWLGSLLRRARGDPPSTMVIAAIEGTAGVGKTALAVRWAHRARDRFPDGQLYADLRGLSLEPALAPFDALSWFLRALGLPPEQLPTSQVEAEALYRSLLADRRVLVALDNVSGPDQVRPLLPGGPGCMVVVTSRHRLTGLEARNGAHRLVLQAMSPDDAVMLLGNILGRDRVAKSPIAAAELADLCGYLPLALRIAATNLATRPQQSIGEYARQLRRTDRMATLATPGDELSAVSAALDLSYTGLPPDAQHMFRLLGLLPGPDVTPVAAAALVKTSRSDAARLLELLAARHLLWEHAAGRYAWNEILRCYASRCLQASESERDRHDAWERLCRHLVSLSEEALHILDRQRSSGPALPGQQRSGSFGCVEDALTWLVAERANLVAVAARATKLGPRWAAGQLTGVLERQLGTGHDARNGLAVVNIRAGSQARLASGRDGLR